MSSKVHVKVEIDLYIVVDEDQDIGEVLDEMEYDFTDTTGGATIEDTNILGYEVTDSR